MKELVEAHLSHQTIRLSRTEHGRAVLRKVGWKIQPQPTTETLPQEWRNAIKTKPLPRNIQPGRNDERRSARARTLARQLEEDPNILYAGRLAPQTWNQSDGGRHRHRQTGHQRVDQNDEPVRSRITRRGPHPRTAGSKDHGHGLQDGLRKLPKGKGLSGRTSASVQTQATGTSHRACVGTGSLAGGTHRTRRPLRPRTDQPGRGRPGTAVPSHSETLQSYTRKAGVGSPDLTGTSTGTSRRSYAEYGRGRSRISSSYTQCTRRSTISRARSARARKAPGHTS